MKTSKLGKILLVALFIMLFTLVLTVAVGAETKTVAANADLSDAIANAAAGDVLVLDGGTYTETAAITINKNLTIQGSGTVNGGAPIFNIAEGVTVTFGGSVKYVGTGIGVSIQGTNTNVTFKDSVRFETTGRVYQDANNAYTSTVTVQDSAFFKSNSYAIDFDGNATTTGTRAKKTVVVTGATFECQHGIVFNVDYVEASATVTNVTMVNKNTCFYATNNNGTTVFTVNGGSYTSTSKDKIAMLSGNGSSTTTASFTDVTFTTNAISSNAGALTAEGGSTVTMTVKNATLNFPQTAILLCASSTLNATLENVTATCRDVVNENGAAGKADVTVKGTSDITCTTGIFSDGTATNGSYIKVNLESGSIKSFALCSDTGYAKLSMTVPSTLNVKGGSVELEQYSAKHGNVTVNITGGTFTVNGVDASVLDNTTGVAKIGDTTYDTLEAAIAAAAAGDTITILKNITITTAFTLNKKLTFTGENVIISQNGVKLTVADGADITFNGNITWLDFATISENTGTAKFVINGGCFTNEYAAMFFAGEQATLNVTINGGTFILGHDLCVRHDDVSGGTTNKATNFTVNDGTFKIAHNTVFRQGYENVQNDTKFNININGGSFTWHTDVTAGSANQYFVHIGDWQCQTVVNIKNATFTVPSTAMSSDNYYFAYIQAYKLDVTLENCTVTGFDYMMRVNRGSATKLTIKSGTYNVGRILAVYGSNPGSTNNSEVINGTLNISGGTFTVAECIVYLENTGTTKSGDAYVTISGGTFSTMKNFAQTGTFVDGWPSTLKVTVSNVTLNTTGAFFYVGDQDLKLEGEFTNCTLTSGARFINSDTKSQTLTLSNTNVTAYDRMFNVTGGANAANITITGGTFTINVGTDKHALMFYSSSTGTSTVTINSGTFINTGDGTNQWDTLFALNGGSTKMNVTIKDGTFNSKQIMQQGNGTLSITIDKGTFTGMFYGNGGTSNLTINGGTFTSTGHMFYSASGTLNLTVNNGTFTSGGIGVYVANGAGTLTFNNATFNTNNEVIKSETNSTSLTLTIKKGSYISTAERVLYANSTTNVLTLGTEGMNNADLIVKTNAASAKQVIADHKGSNSTITVTIWGGTYTTTKAGVIDINRGVTGSFTVNGGYFEAYTSGHLFDLSDNDGLKKIDVTVNGGTFKTPDYFIASFNNTGTLTLNGGEVTCRYGFVTQGARPSETVLTEKVTVRKYGTLNANGELVYNTFEAVPDVKIVISGGTFNSANTLVHTTGATNVYVVISGSPVMTAAGGNEVFLREANVSTKEQWTTIDISGTPTVNFGSNYLFHITNVAEWNSYLDARISGGTFNATYTDANIHYMFRSGDWQGRMSVEISGGTFGWKNDSATKACYLRGFLNGAEYMSVKLSGGTFKDMDMLLEANRSDNGSINDVEISGSFSYSGTMKDSNTGIFYTCAAKDLIRVNMKGGTLTTTNGAAFGNCGKNQVTVSGGTINAASLTNINGGSVDATITVTGTADINLSGTVYLDAPNDNTSRVSVTLAGGTLDATRLYPENMKGTATVTFTGGTYNGATYVQNEAGVVRVGDTYYSSLQAAIDAVTGDTPEAPVTVTIVGGLTITETVVINKNVVITGGSSEQIVLVYGDVSETAPSDSSVFKTFQITAGKNVTFTGYVTYVSSGFFMEESAETDVTTLTFAGNVKVANNESNKAGKYSYAFSARNANAKGKLVFNLQDNAHVTAPHCVIVTGSQLNLEVNITGGKLTSTASTTVYVDNIASLKVTMTGGTIDGVSNAFQFLKVDSDVEITGGTFNVNGVVVLLKQGNHSLTIKNATVTKASDLIKVQDGGNLGTAAAPALVENVTVTLTSAIANFNNGQHFLTVKNSTVTAAGHGIYQTNGATLGSAAAPAVLENVTATVANHVYYSDWQASGGYLHIKSGTYTNTTKQVLILSRSGNENIIIGTEGGSNDAVKLSTDKGSQLFGAHKELREPTTDHAQVPAAANRGIYNLTIYNGTFSVKNNNLIDLNRGLEGAITIYNGVFTVNGNSTVIDMDGTYQNDTNGASMGHNAVDVTLLGGTYTTGGYVVRGNCYTGVITIENVTANCQKFVQLTGGISYTEKDANGKDVTKYTAGSGTVPVIKDSVTAWLTANGMTTVNVKDGLSGTPHVILNVNNVKVTATGEVFRMQGCGNVYMKLGGNNTEITTTNFILQRNMYLDPSHGWQVIDITGGKMTTSCQSAFHFPGGQNAVNNLHIAFNISGGEVIMTRAGVPAGAVDADGNKAYNSDEYRGVNVFQVWKYATHLHVKISGGTFTYAPVGTVGANEVAATSYFFQGGNQLSEVLMTGGTIQGFDMAFWGNYNGTGLLVTLGEQGGNSFPTINVNTAIFYTAPHFYEENHGYLTATVWGGNYTVEGGYIFYVNGYEHYRTGTWKSGTMNFAVHGGTFNAKHFLYHHNGTTGSASTPGLIDGNVTINTTSQAFYMRDNNAYLKIDGNNVTVTAYTHVFLANSPMDNLTVTINGGTFKALRPSDDSTATTSFRIFCLQCEDKTDRKLNITINGGNFESTGEFIWAGRWTTRNITIKAATIVTHSERGIYLSEKGTTNLVLGDANAVNDNSKLSITTEAANKQLIALHGATHVINVTIYGGTFESKQSTFIDVNGGNNSGTITIKGGKITAAGSGFDFDGENKENNVTVGDNVTVTTNFTKNADGSFTPVTKSEKANLVLNITGGTFSVGTYFIVSGNAYNAQANISGPVNVTARNTAEVPMIYHQNSSGTLINKWLQVNISATEAGTPVFTNYSDRMFGQANIGGSGITAYFDINISGGEFYVAKPDGSVSFFHAWDANGMMNVDVSGGTFKWKNPDSSVSEALTWLCVFRNAAQYMNMNVSGGTFENIDLFVYLNRADCKVTNVAVSGTAKVIGAPSTASWGLFLANNASSGYIAQTLNVYISGGELTANNETMMFAYNKHIINAVITGGKLTATAGDTNRGMFSKDGAEGSLNLTIKGNPQISYAGGPIFGYYGKVNADISGGTFNSAWLSNVNNNSYVQNINITGGTFNFTNSLFTAGGKPNDAAVNRVTITIGGGTFTTPKMMDGYWNDSAVYFVFVEGSKFTWNGTVINPDGSGVRDGNVENGTLYPTLQMAYENAVAVDGTKLLVIVKAISVQTPVVFTDTVVITGEAGAYVIGSYDYVDTGILQAGNGAHLTLTGYVQYVNCVIEGLAGSEVTFAGNVKVQFANGAAYVNKGAGNATVNLTENATIEAHYGIFFYDREAKGLATDQKVINVTGGAILSVNRAIDIRSTNANFTINVSGGTIQGSNRAIDISAANAVVTINVSGGVLDATPNNGFAINLTGSKLNTTLNMTAGYIKGNHCVYMNPANGVSVLNISGGTIETINSSAIYQTTATATATVNVSGTASIFGPATSIKGTGGSTLNVNITGGTYQAKWRVVEMDNASGNVVIKNATVTQCASLFYGVNAGTRNVTVENVEIGTVTDTVLVMTVGTHTVNVNGLTVTGAVTAHLFYTSGNAKVTATLANVSAVTSARTFKINGTNDDVNLTIKSGSYTVNNTASDDYVIATAGSATLKLTVNIEGGTFRNTGMGGYFFGSSNGTTEFNISGGDINVANIVFAYWGALKSTINISGGTLTAKRILNISNAPITPTGHTFDVTLNGQQVEKSFQLCMNVSGGTLTSTERTFSMVDNTYVYVHVSGGNIIAPSGYVAYRSDHTDKNYPGQAGAGKGYSYVLFTGGKIEAASSVVEINDAYLDVRIENGEFNHASWLFHVTQDTGNNGMAYATLEIVGGTFKSKDGKGGGICSDNFNEMTVSVTGGTFNYSWEMVKINGSANANVTLGGTVNVTAPRIFWANTGATATTNLTFNGGTYTSSTHFVQQGVTGAEQTLATTNVTIKGDVHAITSGNLFHARGGKMNIAIEDGMLYAPGVAFLSDSNDMVVTFTGGEVSATVLLQFVNSGTIRMTGEDSENVTIRVQQTCLDYVYYDDAEGNRIYAGFVGAVNNAPAGATIYVVGNITITETANRVGDLTIAGNGTVTGSVVFINIVGATNLTFNGDVTYSGTVSIVQIPAESTPFESTVNFTKGIFRVSGTSKTGAVFMDWCPDTITTVNVSEGADIRVGGWGIAFETGRDKDGNGVKTVNMTGGYISGSHGLTFGAGGVQINLTVSGGTIEVTNDALYLHNKYYKTDAQENLLNVNITGGTFIAKSNVIFFDGNANGTINISGGTFRANDIVEMGSTNDVTNSSLKMPGYNGTEEAFNAVINITGGTFEANEKGIYTLGGSRAYVSISDATFVAKQQLIVRRDDGYTGKGYTYVVINGGSYTGVTDTMFWVRDSKLEVVINAGADGSDPVFVSTKHFTYTYQNTGSTVVPEMNLTMNAGNVSCHGYMFAFMSASTGTVNINGGTLTDTYVEANNAASGSMDAAGVTTFNITGGTINTPSIPTFGKGGTTTVNISGGEINTGYLMNANGTVAIETVNVSGTAVINATISVLTDGTAGSKQFLNVAGGVINAPLLASNAFAIEVTVTVTGGEINVRNYTFGATSAVVKNQTTGKIYDDLQAAVNEAVNGDVLEILGDFVLTKQVVVENKTLTITGGTSTAPITVLGAIYTQHRATGSVFATFLLKSGANVTFTGNVNFLESAVMIEGDDIVLTLAGNVKLDSEKHSHVVYNNNAHADGDVTVYITGNATLIGNYAVYFTGDKSMTSTNAQKTVVMNGGLIVANHGLLFQYINGVNGMFNVTGGKIDVLYSAIWLDSHNVDGKRITVILDDVIIESEDVAVTANKNADLLVDIIVYAGTYIHAGLDGLSADSGDCAITLETNANAKPSTLTIYGGTFISETGHAAVQVTSRSAVNANATEATGSKAYIYGGYFVGKTLGAVRASGGGYLYIYGGYFAFESTDGNGGSPVRSGTGSTSAGTATIGNVFVYGGNYYTHSTGAAFATVNELCNLEVKINGVNANGGAYLVNKTNGMVYYGDGERHRDGLISMTDGAGVRIVKDSNGLRFVSVVTGEALAYLDSIGATNVKFGTLIAPVDIVAQARNFTIEDMKAAGLPYLNIIAKDGLVERAAGGYYIRAAITNIQEGNVGREFAAVGYVTYTITDINGEPVEITVYTSYRENKNARSIEQVARLALEDADLYTAAQIEILTQYAPKTEAPEIDFYLVAGQSNAAGSSYFDKSMASINPSYSEGYSHVYYSGSSNRATRLNVPVKLGYGSGDSSFGPELGMAEALSQYYNEETGKYAAIIKYAYGGTRLYDNLSGSDAVEGSWCPPSWLAVNKPLDEVRSGGLFRALVNHVESCVADYEAMGFKVNIKSLYWMQGESDINANGKDGLYDDIFKVWISDLRNSVCAIMGDDSYQSLPIIVGEISEYFGSNSGADYHRKNLEFVQMQREIIGSWENVYVIPQGNVPTVDYPDDNSHWGFHEHIWNGYMVGSKMLEVAYGFQTTVSEEDAVAEVWLDGQLIGTFNNLGGALSMAPEGAVVKLLKDIKMVSTLAVGNRNKITLDGCDHKIDFQPIQTNIGNYAAIKFYNTDITVMNLHVVNHTYTEFDSNGAESKLATYGVVLNFNAKVTWIDGSIEVERHCFVLNNTECELTIVSGDFKLRETAINYAAIIYNGAGNVKVTVEGGNFDSGVGTAYVVYLENDANGSKIVLNGGEFVPGDGNTVVVKNNCTEATIIVGDDAVLNGTVDNVGKSQ